MKKIFRLALPVVLLMVSLSTFTSCKQNLKKVTKESYSDGKPKLEQFFLDDNSNTLVKEIHYHPNHKKKMEGGFINNLRDGLWTAWFEDGKKWSEGYFKNGVDDSLRTVYHPNGTKFYEGLFKDGKRIGVWKFYDENGKLNKQIDFSTQTADSLGLSKPPQR